MFTFHLLSKGLQTELNIAHTHLKEHREIIDELRSVSEKEDEIASTQDTEKADAELQGKVCHFSSCPWPRLPSSFGGK